MLETINKLVAKGIKLPEEWFGPVCPDCKGYEILNNERTFKWCHDCHWEGTVTEHGYRGPVEDENIIPMDLRHYWQLARCIDHVQIITVNAGVYCHVGNVLMSTTTVEEALLWCIEEHANR